MNFTIFDVGHGLCALVQLANGGVMLFDCGHDAIADRRPSAFLRQRLGIQRIDRFFVTNYDEDHVSDHPALRAAYGNSIACLHRNTSMSAEQIRTHKLRENGEISPPMESVCRMIEQYTGTFGPGEAPSLGGARLEVYWNRYGIDFDDTNNVSLVAFVQEGAHKIIIPGDLEAAGWLKLLERPEFRTALGDVTIFVASHHGRESGYCARVFDHCRPIWVVMSDGPIVHATQEMVDAYSTHAVGGRYGGVLRKVLTTRNDGDLHFSW